MRTPGTLLLGFIAAALWITLTPDAEAAIHIYKVTFSAKAEFFPKLAPLGNSRKLTGYLIYDTITPANSQTVETFANKTYRLNDQLLQLIFPSQIGFAAIDRNGDGFIETASALVGFQTGNVTVARSYSGVIPKIPFRLGGVTFVGIAKILKGKGAVTSPGVDHFTVSDTWTLDVLSAIPGVVNSGSTNNGVTAVEVFLQSRGFTKVQ